VILPLLPKPSRKGRPRTTDLREVFDAIQYMLASGCLWQALPKWFPPFTTIRNDVCNWRASGVFDRMLDALHQQERDLPDRSAEPTAAVIDSQFVKTAESGAPPAMTSGRKSRGASVTLCVSRRRDPAHRPRKSNDRSICEKPWTPIQLNRKTTSEVSIIGIDLAKYSFQMHGAVADGSVAFRRKVHRDGAIAQRAASLRCIVATDPCTSGDGRGR